MNSALAKIVRKTADALKLKDVSEKTERLLALREEAGRFLYPAEGKSYFEKSETAAKVCAVSAAVAITGFVTAFLIPPLGVAIAYVAAGSGAISLVALVARHAYQDKMMREYFEPPRPEALRAEADRQKALVVKAAIEQTIAVMLEDAPQEVRKSPRFRKSARAAFNAVSEDEAFDSLVSFNGLVAEAKKKRGFLALGKVI